MPPRDPKKPRYRGKAGEWAPAFLAALADTGNVRASCLMAGIGRQSVYNYRASNARFSAEWDEAVQDAVDVLAAAARKRALETSDTLLIYLLKVHGGPEYRNDQRRTSEPMLSEGQQRVLTERIAAMMGVDPEEIEGALEAANKVARNAWESKA